ncbi:hypothetical protein ACEQ8H_001377 [Pleosporales sp. CAS-2024a]
MHFTPATVAAVAALMMAPISARLAGVRPDASGSSHHLKRADIAIPASQGSVTYKEPWVVVDSFDGGMKTYGRGLECTGQKEGQNKDAVFLVKDGATLKNVIIGKDQSEGVHCEGSCTIENVWWVDVCEDALTLKGNGDALVLGGGAQHAEDKVIQHNGKGTVIIDGFQVSDFGKLYRACGNCKNSVPRSVVIKNVKAYHGKVLAGINSNFGGTASITDTCATDVETICEEYKGTTPGHEPEPLCKGPSKNCKYSAAAIKAC